MPRQLPPLNALRAFEAAGRHENFSRAAEELNVSHAAISRHVRGLEQRLDVQLLVRAARGVELTKAGADYLSKVRLAFDDIAAATGELSEQTYGTVSVSCEATFAIRWLARRLGGLRQKHPQIEIDFDATNELADVAKSQCDLAIRFCSRPYKGLESDLLADCVFYPYCSPDMNIPDTPAGLLDYPLLHERRGIFWRRWFAEAGIEDVVLPPLTGGHASLLAIEGALSGQGFAILSHELVSRDVEEGRLKRAFPIGMKYGSYRLIYRRESLRRKELRILRDWLLDETSVLREPHRNKDDEIT